MGVELVETLSEAITAYTGLSPNAFFTVVAAAIAVYYIFSVLLGGSSERHRPHSFEEDVQQPLPPPVQLGEISEEDLKAYDGNDPQKPLLMAIKAQIYDVSQSRDTLFYFWILGVTTFGLDAFVTFLREKLDSKVMLIWIVRMFYGPGGPYALFAGKDASRALAKMSFDEKDLNGDLTGLGAFELDALQDWEYKFMSKYVQVGSIKKPEAGAPEKSAADPSTTDVSEPTEGKEKLESSTTTEGRAKDE